MYCTHWLIIAIKALFREELFNWYGLGWGEFFFFLKPLITQKKNIGDKVKCFN